MFRVMSFIAFTSMLPATINAAGKSRIFNEIVIPAKAGIQVSYVEGAHLCVALLGADTQVCPYWSPVFTGVTTLYEAINSKYYKKV